MNSKIHQLESTFIRPEQSIIEALRAINDTALQIALVVDEDQKLVGTVTDGDIRRGILNNIPLEDPVKTVMNKTPITVTPETDIQKILNLMTEKKIYQVPVLDKDGQVIALERMRELLKRQSTLSTAIHPTENIKTEDVTVVLMLGGEGTRLQPLTQDMPKPMISVGGKPLLETIIGTFVSQKFTKFYFSLNYKADMIRDHFGDGSKFGANISYIIENEKRGTAGSLSLLPEKPKGPVIVMNGDLLTNTNFDHLVEFHRQNKVLATMCVREYSHEVPYGIVQNNGVMLDSIVEKPMQSFFVNAGIYVLDPSALNLVPKDQFFDMPQLFEKIKETGAESAVFPIHEYWLDIGRMEDLERARVEYKEVFS